MYETLSERRKGIRLLAPPPGKAPEPKRSQYSATGSTFLPSQVSTFYPHMSQSAEGRGTLRENGILG